jgi:stage V sporulation protein R
VASQKTPRSADPYEDLLGIFNFEEIDSASAKNPTEPEKDLLWFISRCSPVLQDWQRDIIDIVRQEMLYFIPQMQTKILNEGWASFWHLRIMQELDLSEKEYLEFAQLHSGVIAPMAGNRGINPYVVGLKIF